MINSTEGYAFKDGDLIFLTQKTTQKKCEAVLRNNIPIKRIVKHLYASHRNDEIQFFLEFARALQSGQPIYPKHGGYKEDGWTKVDGLYYAYNFYKDRVVLSYNR
jgi:hypothetical protein